MTEYILEIDSDTSLCYRVNVREIVSWNRCVGSCISVRALTCRSGTQCTFVSVGQGVSEGRMSMC